MASDPPDSEQERRPGVSERVRVAVVGGARLYREGLAAALDRSASIELVLDDPDVVVLEDPGIVSQPPASPRARLVALGALPPRVAGGSPFTAWVPDDASLSELVEVVVRVARQPYAEGGAGTGRRPTRHALPPLTGRETEVLQLIAEALSNREIAERLQVEVSTVKNHIHHVLQKLGTKRRAQAAAWFRSHQPGRG